MRTRRVFIVAATAAAGLLFAAAPAAAHVTVNPKTAPAGGYVEESFRAPTESATASTVKLQVFFPTDLPIASALVKPVPGWHASVKTKKPAKPIKTDDGQVDSVVSGITWSGGTLKPGEFQDFDVSLGPLPDKVGGKLVFKALQTYSDGKVVRWIDLSKEGQPEPAHPAPVLSLVSTATPDPNPTTSTAPMQMSSASGSDDTARDLAAVALLAGVIGIVLGAVGLRAVRNRS